MTNIVNKLLTILLIIFSGVMMQSCDSGDIYPEEKKPDGTDIDVNATFRFSHIETFPESYKVIFGSFKDDSPYPISSVVISKPSSDKDLSISLNNIPKEATYVALYLVQEHSNAQIYPFYKYTIDSPLEEDLEIPLQEIDLAVSGRIQHQVFSQCLQCHGGSGFAAAGLYLTEDKSFSMLVNGTAKNSAEKKLVTPHNAQGSFLMDVLKGEALQSRHSSLSSLKDDDITLVEQWINDGAEH